MDNRALAPHRLHWLALGLLVVSVCINYIDRGNLGVAAHSMADELHFTPDQLGVLLGSVFWTYSLCQPAAGKLIDIWNVNWVYAAGFLVWSAATLLTGVAGSFTAILLLRLLLGAGESISYPAYSKIIATFFPENLRGTANALIDAGSKVGPALGVLIGVKMVSAFSWRYMFLVIGGMSLLWLVPWVLVVPHLPKPDESARGSWAPSYSELLRKRQLWGAVVGLFGANYLWYFFLTWLPYYFETARHYTKNELAIFASLPFWAVAAASLSFGLLADWFISRGHKPGRVRQTFVSVGLLGCCVFTLPAALVKEEWASILLVTLSCICMAGYSSNHWALAQTLSGREGAAKWTGFENCVGNFAGVIAPYLSGLTLRETHSFVPAFAIACLASMMAVIGFWFIIGDPIPVRWKSMPELEPVAQF